MGRWRREIRAITILALVAGVGLGLSHLALVDIWHGTESDLALEWWVLRVGFILQWLLILTFLNLSRKILISDST